MTKRAVVADNNATTNQQREQQRAGNGCRQDYLSKGVNDWHQKWPTMRVLMVTPRRVITKAGCKKIMQQPTNVGSSKGFQGLVTRPPGGSGCQLAEKAASDMFAQGRAMTKGRRRWQAILQQPTNNGSSKGRATACVETT
jgi:hypothetical protein